MTRSSSGRLALNNCPIRQRGFRTPRRRVHVHVASWKLDRASGCESRPGRYRSAGWQAAVRWRDLAGRAGCREPVWREQSRGS
jgi:hypothetical protein